MQVPNSIWRTYRGGKCLCFNMTKISKRLSKSTKELYQLNDDGLSITVGQPVIFYQRFKENPLKDKVYTAIVTDTHENQRFERTMVRLYRCNFDNLQEKDYNDAMKMKLGVSKRMAFCIPYTPEAYRTILEWLWQVRYLLTEKVYQMFPIEQDVNILKQLSEIDNQRFIKESKEYCGFDVASTNADFKRGYNRIDYKKIANQRKKHENSN